MRIGIIGAGQLGRMLALAGYPLGLRFSFLDRGPDTPGGQVADIVSGEFSDPDKIAELARRVDVLTFDVENVPADAVLAAAGDVPFLPPLPALATSQDRLSEKRLFGSLEIPTPAYRSIDSLEELRGGVSALGLPCVLKTRRLGYDGRGQRVLHAAVDVAPAWEALGGVPLILEAFVDFSREVSIVGVRSTHGESKAYALAENRHRDGILIRSLAPYADEALTREANDYLSRVLEHFDYVGVLTIEFFVRDGRLLANELAPRVHNSGHWTIEGAVTSQFENHLRAIIGLPLGDVSPVGHSAMVNLIGDMPSRERLLRVGGLHYHDYGKPPRPGRKLGHCAITAPTVAERDRAVDELMGLLKRE